MTASCRVILIQVNVLFIASLNISFRLFYRTTLLLGDCKMTNRFKPALAAATLLTLGLTSFSAAAYEAGDWVVRARLIHVDTNEDTSTIRVLMLQMIPSLN